MQQPHISHHIQLGILRQMLLSSESRYSDMKPKNVESNLFMYHLKQLIREGLIEKHDKIYTLTREGKRFADRATLETMRIRVQPKIVIVLCIRREDGKWLIMRRKHQPFVDYKGFPSGKMHYGETLQQAAERELREKTGLTGVDLTLRGNVVMRFTEDGEIVNHIIGYVVQGGVARDVEVDFDSEYFQTFMGEDKDLFEEPCFKGHHEIFELLQSDSNDLIMREYEFASDY
jgi:8-oxo-dGTP pyrophosphatase MutT (NUDIX family)